MAHLFTYMWSALQLIIAQLSCCYGVDYCRCYTRRIFLSSFRWFLLLEPIMRQTYRCPSFRMTISACKDILDHSQTKHRERARTKWQQSTMMERTRRRSKKKSKSIKQVEWTQSEPFCLFFFLLRFIAAAAATEEERQKENFSLLAIHPEPDSFVSSRKPLRSSWPRFLM